MTWRKLDTRSGEPIIKDRRNEDTGEPSAEDKASNEADRQARREDIKFKIARFEILKQRADLLAEEIARLDQEAERAADDHQQACTPLQGELEALEQKAIERIARREPADAAEDGRRAAIISEITEHNKTLESVTERCKKLKQPLERERQKLAHEAAPLEAEKGKLTRIGVASPALLVQAHVARRRIDIAAARLQAAKKAMAIIRSNLAGIRDGLISSSERAIQEHKADCWAAEIEAAQQEQADALAASREVHAAMIAE